MGKDQAYGGLITVIALIVAVVYVVASFASYLGLPMWLRDAAIGIPVFLFVMAMLVICMWIGWTMLTTPPPAPLEAEAPPEPAATETKSGEEKQA